MTNSSLGNTSHSNKRPSTTSKVTKTYLVFNKTTGLVTFFDNWLSCKQHVSHRSNVLYKSFKEKSLAEEYGDELKERFEKAKTQFAKTKYFIYIDGSYQPKCPYASWAYVIIDAQGNKVTELSGMCEGKAVSRNIDGEVYAAIHAGKWALKYKREVTLFYDYQGLESWALGDWKSKTDIASFYTSEIKKYLPYLSFKKVKAHTGDKWNEYVDQLAKNVIQKYLNSAK